MQPELREGELREEAWDVKFLLDKIDSLAAALAASQETLAAARETAARLDEELERACNRAGASQEKERQLRGALKDLDAWASRMPDAGFSSSDPRWGWWHARPDVSAALDSTQTHEGGLE